MGSNQSGTIVDPVNNHQPQKQSPNPQINPLNIKQSNTNTNHLIQFRFSQLRAATKSNLFNPGQMVKSSVKSKANLDTSQLFQSGGKSGKRYKLDSQIVKVPFKVIMATMDKDLKQSFQKLAKQVKTEYEKQQQEHWKLHGNGYYINYQQGQIICIITSTTIYKGVLIQNKQKLIVPDGQGLLIDCKGKYMGQFKNGRANGNGAYTVRDKGTVFSGRWDDGKLVHGTIENQTFKFMGDMKDGLADGKGAVKFKKTGSSYIGFFRKGLYHTSKDDTKDIQALDKYVTNDYTYTGDFVKGMKEGRGQLQEKYNPDKVYNKKQKYRPIDSYDGNWIEDYYVTTREEKQKKKMQYEQIYQHIGQQVIAESFDPNKSQRTSDFDLKSKKTIDVTKNMSTKKLMGKLVDGVVQTLITDNQVPQYVVQQDMQSEL